MIKNANDAAGYFKRKEINSGLVVLKDGVLVPVYPTVPKQTLPEGHKQRVEAFRVKVQGKVASINSNARNKVYE